MMEVLECRRLLAADSMQTDGVAEPNSIAGFVHVDANRNGIRDTDESGVPGVQIMLSGTDVDGMSVSRTLLTTDKGAYCFADLPAGTYDISQRQPTAMSDGSESTSVPGAVAEDDAIRGLVLTDDEGLAGNNFGERALLPQYSNIIWFFASSLSNQVNFREVIARAEELAGNTELAEAIREGGTPPGENTAPVAVDDSYEVDEDQMLTVDEAMGVLANDTDADGDALSVRLVTPTSDGALTLSSDGSFEYTPNAEFNGTDSFAYAVEDGAGGVDEATATIEVNAVNDPPVANDDDYSTDEDMTLAVDIAFGLLGNDEDVEGDDLTAVLVDPPSDGTLSLSPDGSFSYVPDANSFGTDSFRYVASDEENESEPAEVVIEVSPVEDPPTIVLPAEFSDPHNVPTRPLGQPIEFTVEVQDPDDDDYVFQLDLESSGIPANEAMPTIDAQSGQFLWTPTATGRFNIRVIVVNGEGEADQETFLIDIVSG